MPLVKRGSPRKLELRQNHHQLQYKTICRSLPITIILWLIIYCVCRNFQQEGALLVKTGLASLIGSSTLLAFSPHHSSLSVAGSLAAHLSVGVGSALFRLYKRVLYAGVSLLQPHTYTGLLALLVLCGCKGTSPALFDPCRPVLVQSSLLF
jgi:hypothetical protein